MNRMFFLLWLTLTLNAVPPWCLAQETTAPATVQPPVVVRLPVTTTWKFGIRVTGTGETRNAQVTFPLPVDWPEQKIHVVSIDTTENVAAAKIRKLGSDASQMFFRIPRLQADEVAEVSVTMQIEKRESRAPADPSRFVFGDSRSRKLRGYLTPSPYIESNDDRIVELANGLPVNPDETAWQQVETIYRWVRENLEYRFDTEIRSCLEAVDTGHGDCEEMSSLFIALCRARGIPARAVWIPEHTYPEFYLEDADGNGHWFPCQAAGSYAFGHMPEARPILQKGDKFRVPGHSRPLRYIQPTMKAYGSTPRWAWLMTQAAAATTDQ
jgi:hypothetical protein